MTTETILTVEQVGDLYLDWKCFFKDTPGSASLCIRAIEQAVLQSPEVQALREQADLYQWIKKNIKEGYEFDGGYYISDTNTGNWDRTVRAAMEQQT